MMVFCVLFMKKDEQLKNNALSLHYYVITKNQSSHTLKMSQLEIGKCYTGKEFKKLCPHTLYRITNEDEIHNGFQYNTGLNVDTLPFNPTESCKSGGMYFFDRTQIKDYKKYAMMAYWIRQVIILEDEDSLVYVEEGKYKTNKFILNDRIRIGYDEPDQLCEMYDMCINLCSRPFDAEYKENLHYLTLKKYPYFFRDHNKRTEELCLEAINQDASNLQYVEIQTEEMCLEAVKRDAMSLLFVKEQTHNICLEAVKNKHIISVWKLLNKTD